MFKAEEIKVRMDAQPFRPFRICMSDGKTYEIANHDMAFVKRNAVQIGIDVDSHGLAEFFTECAIMHITRIEDIESAKAA